MIVPSGGIATTPSAIQEAGGTVSNPRPPAAPTRATLAIAAANPDPAISEPAKKALAAYATPANAGSFEDYVTKKYGPTPTPAQIVQAHRDLDKPTNVTVNAGLNSQGGIGTLDKDGLELAGTTYRLTGKLPARDAKQNGAIMSVAAKQGKTLGNTPAATIQKQAAYSGDAKALAKMQSMSAAAEAFESKANAQAQLVVDLSKKVGRTQFPVINDILLSGKERVLGDENTHLFSNALLTFTTEYAKIMEGSTGSSAGSSEGARRDAAKLISTGLNNGTIEKTIAQMQWEMQQTVLGYDIVKQHISERMVGQTPQPQTKPPTGRYNPATGKIE